MASGVSRVAAFDAVAAGYDASFGRRPAGLVFRHVVQSRLLALFRRGDRVLDVGCGTGEDALLLASRGVRVVGIDSSPAMIGQARRKAAERGLTTEDCRFEVRAVEDLAVEDLAGGGAFGGAYSNFGALNCADLRAAGGALAAALRPGAAVVLSLLGPWPLPATLRRALTGLGERRRDHRPRVGGIPLAVGYPTPAEARSALGPAFTWTDAYALGVLLPAPEHSLWAAEHPQAFALAAALERAVRGWPGLRLLGDHLVLEGRREASR